MLTDKPLVVGNWKLNPNTLQDALDLASAINQKTKKTIAQVVIAPPYLYLIEVNNKIKKGLVVLAAQDVSAETMGAFTGEISAMQLRNINTDYVIVGHSERRAGGETDAQVVKKVSAILNNKMTPIVCIGEKERDSQGAFFNVIENQLRSLCLELNAISIKKVVIAYEPIWAIGTGKTATTADVKEMQLFLFSLLTKIYDKATAKKVCLLYGGSVKPENAYALHQEGGMNGFLVGGASLKAEDFVKIINATSTK